MASRLVRTEISGVFRRGSKYTTSYRDCTGRQRWISGASSDEVLALRREAREREANGRDDLAAAFINLGVAQSHVERESRIASPQVLAPLATIGRQIEDARRGLRAAIAARTQS